MSKRKVTLKLTSQRSLVQHETEARTFGELKKELSNVSWESMRVVERSTKTTLQMNEAVLPAGDFFLFVVPEKVKSGQTEMIEDVDSASYNELRSHISYLNKTKGLSLSVAGSIDELRQRVKDHYASDNDESQEETEKSLEEVMERIEGTRAKINDNIDQLINSVKNLKLDDGSSYAIKVSFDELDQELNEIKSSLKL